MDDNSFHIHHVDYPKLNKDFLIPQQVSSTYYSYPNSTYDQFINNNTIYNGKAFSINLILSFYFLGHSSVSTHNLSPSNESINKNTYQSYDCKINWGKINEYF
jgi:hypothetical protein